MSDQEIILRKEVEEVFDNYNFLDYTFFKEGNNFYLNIRYEGRFKTTYKLPDKYFLKKNNKRIIKECIENFLNLYEFIERNKIDEY